MSVAAYGRVQNVAENPRQIEFRLLGQVTGAMLSAKEAPDRRGLFDAVLWNQQVWNTFLVDLTSGANGLPDALRARLVSIALWVNRETDEVVAGKADVETLVTVNRAIMDGLR